MILKSASGGSEQPGLDCLSIFPFSAPIEVMLRFGITGITIWQIITSRVLKNG
jgi:hypothetical protein